MVGGTRVDLDVERVDAARMDTDKHLVGTRLGTRDAGKAEWRAVRLKDGCLHGGGKFHDVLLSVPQRSIPLSLLHGNQHIRTILMRYCLGHQGGRRRWNGATCASSSRLHARARSAVPRAGWG